MQIAFVGRLILILATLLGMSCAYANADPPRARARDLGIVVGVIPTGPLNAITDVAGVAVGQTTLIEGDDVRTGVTAVLPHSGNLFQQKVPGAVFVGNGFGKLAGSTQVDELGEIESPIVLTTTLSVPNVADAVIGYVLSLPGNEDIRSINPLVGETNDGRLNDIRSRRITRDHVLSAIRNAKGGPVEEGAVGAGTGTIAFGFKGGIGTSSRRLPAALGGYTVGVLVQTNFGGVLAIAGAPVGQELGQYYLKDELSAQSNPPVAAATETSGDCEACAKDSADGSIMIIVATDAPLDARNLRRLASRAIFGLARTGSGGSGGSGDYVIAFSTAPELRITSEYRLRPSLPLPLRIAPTTASVLPNDAMSPLFLAVIEATEEAIYNSLFRAISMTGKGTTIEALPIERTVAILRKHQLLKGVGGDRAARPH